MIENRRSPSCDSQQLRLLLADQLPEDISAQTAEHVAACDACRAELERLAGEPGWWSEVAVGLSAAAGETAQKGSGVFFGQLASHVENSSAEKDARPLGASIDELLPADFAVEFLEPCDRPDALGRLGAFEILEVINRGGMGVVLKGFQPELGRYVAIKVMAPHLAASGSARQRFAREARAAAAIVHPHVMAIHSVSAAGRLPFLVMPFVACESLQERLDREGPLGLHEILRIGVQTAAGLAAAHAQGLVHRDVKPANILLELGVDRVMLTDFGLARAVDDASLTRTGVIAGTPQYMSPEQARGDAVDHRTDLFSLGSVLYAMCTGRPPFRAETSYGVLRRITDTQPRPIREITPDVPEWLTKVVARLHAKEPTERVSTAEEVSGLLEQCLAHVQQPTVVALPESLQDRVVGTRPDRLHSPWVRRMVAAFVVITLAAGLGTWAVMHQRPPERRGADPSPPAGSLTSPATGGPSDETVSADATWSDGAGPQIEDLEADAAELEQRSSRLWDEPNTNSQ
jgi:serine/threonine-protein kinase